MHAAKILKNKLNGLNFVKFFHLTFLETIHTFLHKAISTIISISAESDFLMIIFSVFSSLKGSMFKKIL